VASVAAVVATVGLRIMFLRFGYGRLTARELPEIKPILRIRKKRTAGNMNLMIPIVLRILVYIIFRHPLTSEFETVPSTNRSIRQALVHKA
jgi:hypothetical protein